MKKLGLSLGRGDGSYGPEAILTRAQMASFLVRLWRDVLDRQCPEGEAPFTDVADGAPHAGKYRTAYTTSVSPGCHGNDIRARVNSEGLQISRFLLRTFEKVGGSCPDRLAELDEAVSCLQGLTRDSHLEEGSSQEPVTRAQMAVYMVGYGTTLLAGGFLPLHPNSERTPPRMILPHSVRLTTLLVIAVLDSLRGSPEQRTGYGP